MPVEDHPVHESVRQGEEARYGCHNNPGRKRYYYAPDRKYHDNGPYVELQTPIENSMSGECRFDKSLSDPKCEGCKHRGSGEAYDERVRREGK